jgi:hypothetical protein
MQGMGKENPNTEGSEMHSLSATRVEAVTVSGRHLTKGKFIKGSFYAREDSAGRPLNKTFQFEGNIIRIFPDGFSLPTGTILFSQEGFVIDDVK